MLKMIIPLWVGVGGFLLVSVIIIFFLAEFVSGTSVVTTNTSKIFLESFEHNSAWADNFTETGEGDWVIEGASSSITIDGSYLAHSDDCDTQCNLTSKAFNLAGLIDVNMSFNYGVTGLDAGEYLNLSVYCQPGASAQWYNQNWSSGTGTAQGTVNLDLDKMGCNISTFQFRFSTKSSGTNEPAEFDIVNISSFNSTTSYFPESINITLDSGMPANNSIITNRWIFFNTTIQNGTTIDNFTVRMNGVNYSSDTCYPQANLNTTCYINFTNLNNGNYSFIGFINDTRRNTGRTINRTIHILIPSITKINNITHQDNTSFNNQTESGLGDTVIFEAYVENSVNSNLIANVTIDIFDETNTNVLVNNATMSKNQAITNGFVYNYSYMIPSNEGIGEWKAVVHANSTDNAGFYNDSNYFFKVYDLFVNITSPNTTNYVTRNPGNSVIVYVNISKNGTAQKNDVTIKDLYIGEICSQTPTQINWTNSSYLYRKALIATDNSNRNLTNWSFVANLDTATLISAGKMDSTCKDILIYWGDNITIFGIEGCNTDNTNITFRVNVNASYSTTVYMYYGTSLSVSWNNLTYKDARYEFWDDFQDGSFTDRWEKVSGDVWEQNGVMNLTDIRNDLSRNGVRTKKNFTGSIKMTYDMTYSSVQDESLAYIHSNNSACGGWNESCKGYSNFYYGNNNRFRIEYIIWPDMGRTTLTPPGQLDGMKATGSRKGVVLLFNLTDKGDECNGTLSTLWNGTDLSLGPYAGSYWLQSNISVPTIGCNGTVGFNSRAAQQGLPQDKNDFDNVTVEKYTYPIPTVSVGNEELGGAPTFTAEKLWKINCTLDNTLSAGSYYSINLSMNYLRSYRNDWETNAVYIPEAIAVDSINITITSNTPANNSVLMNDSIFFNTTVQNGTKISFFTIQKSDTATTNYTGTCEPQANLNTTCYYNFTSLSTGNFSFVAYINDTIPNKAQTINRTIHLIYAGGITDPCLYGGSGNWNRPCGCITGNDTTVDGVINYTTNTGEDFYSSWVHIIVNGPSTGQNCPVIALNRTGTIGATMSIKT